MDLFLNKFDKFLKRSNSRWLSKITNFFFVFLLVFSVNGQNALSMSNEDCLDCHSDEDLTRESDDSSVYVNSDILARSVHGEEECVSCHQDADTEDDHPEKLAPVNCAECHDDVAAMYQKSIHGIGAVGEDVLVVYATCANCHTEHQILPASDPDSSVNRNHVAETCGKCHVGVAGKLKKSIHNPPVAADKSRFPVCTDCHSSHGVTRISTVSFRKQEASECELCHQERAETYNESYHGRASMLAGGERAATCGDCHGSHNILAVKDPGSTLAGENAVATCKKCHLNANLSFTTYRTHATHGDKKHNPDMYYTFWGMTILLLSTFGLFGLHTLLWFPRSFKERMKMIKARREHQP